MVSDRTGDGQPLRVCADVAQLVEHHLAKVRVAGSNPVVRSRRSVCPCGMPLAAEWPSGLGKGLQSPVHGFDSRLRLHDSPGHRVARPDEAVPLSFTPLRTGVRAHDQMPRPFTGTPGATCDFQRIVS